MVKIRYFRFRFPRGIGFEEASALAYSKADSSIAVLKASSDELILRYTVTRYISTLQYLGDGTEKRESLPTMEQRLLRFFSSGSGVFLSLVDPPRGGRIVSELLDALFGASAYAVEALEINKAIIDRHLSGLDVSKLVSAKVRDFRIYENAIARLEVSAKEGLKAEIAPFLSGVFHRIDSLTYEITQGLTKGQIQYSSNGTVRITEALVDIGFGLFEKTI